MLSYYLEVSPTKTQTYQTNSLNAITRTQKYQCMPFRTKVVYVASAELYLQPLSKFSAAHWLRIAAEEDNCLITDCQVRGEAGEIMA